MSTNILLTGYNIQFDIGQLVYLKTDNAQHERIVTAINLRPDKIVTYCLSFGTTESWHYEIEISCDRNIIKAL